MAPSRVSKPKPAVHRLRAEVPWNYILGRLAAALQSVFVFLTPLPPFFSDTMTKILFRDNITGNEEDYLLYYHIIHLVSRVQESEDSGNGAGFYSA